MPAPRQNKFILTIAEAIAHKEGFYAQGTNPAKRNNNPGNLRNWDADLPKDKSGFTEFPSRKEGFLALYRQIEKNVVERELTLHEFFAGKPGVYGGYAPSTDNNDPFNYAKFVEGFLEDRGFYPISIDHGLKHWWEELSGVGASDKFSDGNNSEVSETSLAPKHNIDYVFNLTLLKEVENDINYVATKLNKIIEGKVT